VAIGVRPNVTLANDTGLKIGNLGGIDVNEYMQTSDPDIYAVGDCVETVNRITGKKVLAPYGDLANLQGRVAGENAASENCVTFPGTIQTGICKVFDYAAAPRTFRDSREKMSYHVINVPTAVHGRKLLVTKLIADQKTGKLLALSALVSNVSKQIAQWAMAIQGKLTVEDIINADSALRATFF